MNSTIYLNKLKKDTFAIFLFHGVINETIAGIRNYTKKHIQIDIFEEIISTLKKQGNAVSMDEITHCFNNNEKLPEYSYAITFDDGFENNYSLAVPVLEKYRTPAVFYVSTNLIDNNYMTWIDKIEYCIDNVSKIEINLPWNDISIKLTNNQSKIKCLNQIRKNVKLNPNKYNPDKIIETVFEQCSKVQISSNNHILDKKMNWNQINLIHNHPLFEIGGHSHNHVSLGSINSKDLKEEVGQSIKLLTEKGKINLEHYSYPEGQENDYSDEVILLLETYGIKCCPTAIDGLNNHLTNPFHLKRIML